MQISDMIDGPINMVTFDLYDTLVESDPPAWVRLQAALRQHDFDAPELALKQACLAGEHFYTDENGRLPIRDRGVDGQLEFRRSHTGVALESLGLPTDEDTVEKVMLSFRDEGRRDGDLQYRLHDDVLPALSMLKKAGIMRALISNADADVTRFCLQMGFAEEMDTIVTSALVGWEKPDARTFYAALEPFNMPAGNALHVGDQPGSDIVGARAVGMAAALIDRYDMYPTELENALHVTSLTQLAELVIAYNQSL